ncbi:MAG: hypothetical protein NZV14_00525 [Bryobacteraceae bacterium]|nr:hypothetical protein [Bryobacteraceae bacterium]MDW8376616.1 hypothetical protein [Bryobacterales bacterium]
MNRVIRYRAMAAWLLSASLFAAEWNRKPFPDWSHETVLRLLTDSPWAKRRSVTFTWRKPEPKPFTYKDVPGADPSKAAPIGSPVGGIGGKPRSDLPEKGDLLIRWASALPIRHAKALYQLRQEKLPLSQLNPLIATMSGAYVLEIFGLPVEMAHLGAGTLELLAKQNVILRSKSGRLLKPFQAEARVSTEITLFIYFPRENPLRLEDQEIECEGDLQIFRFREKFRLPDMRYQERLEI